MADKFISRTQLDDLVVLLDLHSKTPLFKKTILKRYKLQRLARYPFTYKTSYFCNKLDLYIQYF